MYRSLITNEEINGLELIQFEGRIHLVDSIEQQDDLAGKLLNEKILGFDTETKPSFKKGVIHQVALLQLATRDDAYLFRIMKTGIGDRLKKILENQKIAKLGVAIEDDIADLKKLRSFSPGGFVSFEREVKKVGIESNGLRKLAAIILDKRISKSAQVSNWEAEELTEKQLIYAATDAWISVIMADRIKSTHPEQFEF